MYGYGVANFKRNSKALIKFRYLVIFISVHTTIKCVCIRRELTQLRLKMHFYSSLKRPSTTFAQLQF